MTEGITKSGIKFSVDERITKDVRFLNYFIIMQKENAEVLEQAEAFLGLMTLLFGGAEGVARFEDAVASVHDGICDNKSLMDELSEILAALNLKN